MTMEQIAQRAQGLLSSPVNRGLQEQWLQDLELQVWQEVFCACADAPAKPEPAWDAPMLIEAPYTDVYVYHILRQEALLVGDMEQYNQYLLLFSSRYREFAAWYLRNHRVLSVSGNTPW